MLSVSQWCPSTHIKHYKHAKNHTMISAVCLERQAVTAPQQLQQQRQQSKQQQQQQHQATQSASLQTWSKQVYNNHLLNTPSSMGRRRRKPTSKRRGTDTTTSTASSSSSSSSRDALEHIRLWTPLHNKLLQSLRRQQVLPQHARVLVAVSGGQDSIAMLRLLLDLSQRQLWPLHLVVGHCDHRVRPDSADNAAHVARCCEALGLPYMQAVADREQGHWAEAPAREWRRRQLVRMAAESGCDFLALGHTATERAETVLLNMIRGAGLRGMGAMDWSRPLQPGLQLVRPLLDFSRVDTLAACELTGMEVYPDSTNLDQCYVRNKLRLAVFPLLQEINPAAADHICSAAEIAQLEWQLVDELARGQLAAAAGFCRIVSRSKHAEPQEQQQQQHQGGHHLQQHQQRRWRPEQEHQVPAVALSHWLHGGIGSGSFAMFDGLELVPRLPLQGPQQLGGAAAFEASAAHSELISVQPRRSARQQQHQQQAWDQAKAQLVDTQLQALSVTALRNMHPALQRRVVQLWLSQHTPKSVTHLQVHEVLQLLQPGHDTGSKTSTLWRSSCVMRYRQLLLVLDASMGQELLSGQLQVQREAIADAVSTQHVGPSSSCCCCTGSPT